MLVNKKHETLVSESLEPADRLDRDIDLLADVNMFVFPILLK
jgi:hypothetical protein